MKVKLIIFILFLVGCALQSRANLEIETESTDTPYQVKITMVNRGNSPVSFKYPMPSKYPDFYTYSPFHWRIQSSSPIPVTTAAYAPELGKWSTARVFTSTLYSSDQFEKLFENKQLAPSEKISYTGDIRRIMPFFDWANARGEVIVEFKYPFGNADCPDPVVSRPLKIKLPEPH
jgi:hypothetical protein